MSSLAVPLLPAPRCVPQLIRCLSPTLGGFMEFACLSHWLLVRGSAPTLGPGPPQVVVDLEVPAPQACDVLLWPLLQSPRELR